MATVAVNTSNHIEFRNITSSVPTADQPTLVVQAGNWSASSHTEAGVIFDVYGDQAPILTPADARKLAKWLARAADDLEDKKPEKKGKQKYRHEDDDNYDEWRG